MTDVAGHSPSVSRGRAWFTVILLLFLYLCSMLDRNIINILIVPAQQVFDIGDFEAGLLLGPAFGISYVLLAFPLAWLADRWSRRGIVLIGIIVWSISNIAAGLSHSFETLFLTRVGVGAGEAALVPAAYVLISDLFPRRTLALALSIFSLGSIGGLAVGYGLGGWLLDTLHGGRVIPFFGYLESWRLVFFITGIPSLLLGALLYFVPEKKRTQAERSRSNGVPLLPYIRRHPWPALGIPVAFAFCSLCSATMLAWLPSYMIPEFGWTATKVGAILAALMVFVASVGKIGSGVIVDWLFSRGMLDAHPRYLLSAMLVSVPAVIAAFFAGPTMFIALIAVWVLLAYPVQGYGAAAIQVITPDELRGRMSAIFIVIINIMSATVGPMFAGYFSEHVFTGPHSLRFSLITTFAVWGPATIVLVWLLLPGTRRAVEENRPTGRVA